MLRHIESGRMEAAAALVRQALPLAGVLGRLCHHPCEQGCRRGNWDSPAAIRELEKHVTDWEFGFGVLPMMKAAPGAELPVSGKSVVIIGAGPTGLAAAHYLVRQGHKVSVVDRQAEAGGTLRGVAENDLPSTVWPTRSRYSPGWASSSNPGSSWAKMFRSTVWRGALTPFSSPSGN